MNNHNTLSAGDIAQLKSGGPLMTVQAIHDAKALCSWFVDGNIKNHIFSKEGLEKSKD